MIVIIVSMLLIAAVASLSVYATVIETLYNQFHGENLALIKYAITYKLFIRSLLYIFAIAVISIFISHRMAGPVYKFEHTIKSTCPG